MSGHPNPRVGIAAIIWRQVEVDGVSTIQFLVGCRKGSHGAGTLAFPGGHLEFGESWEECAAREVEEETGIISEFQENSVVYLSNDVFLAENKHYVTLFLATEVPAETIPELREPHKCESWNWYTDTQIREFASHFIPLKSLLNTHEDLGKLVKLDLL